MTFEAIFMKITYSTTTKLRLLRALCQILLMGHFRRRPVLAPGAAFFQLPFPFDAIGSGR
ncbi:hypothetical protein DB329_10725 [Limosilactobacillus fermentum]|nr:hypothetical protein DB329_10725 [Limosilactobacillus fermentum]